MDDIQDLMEDEYTLEAHYNVIISYLQVSSLFLKEKLDGLSRMYTPLWSAKLKEALTLESLFFFYRGFHN